MRALVSEIEIQPGEGRCRGLLLDCKTSLNLRQESFAALVYTPLTTFAAISLHTSRLLFEYLQQYTFIILLYANIKMFV